MYAIELAKLKQWVYIKNHTINVVEKNKSNKLNTERKVQVEHYSPIKSFTNSLRF